MIHKKYDTQLEYKMRNLSIEGKNISKTLNAHKIINNLDMYVPQNSITLIKGIMVQGKV